MRFMHSHATDATSECSQHTYICMHALHACCVSTLHPHQGGVFDGLFALQKPSYDCAPGVPVCAAVEVWPTYDYAVTASNNLTVWLSQAQDFMAASTRMLCASGVGPVSRGGNRWDELDYGKFKAIIRCPDELLGTRFVSLVYSRLTSNVFAMSEVRVLRGKRAWPSLPFLWSMAQLQPLTRLPGARALAMPHACTRS